MSDHDQPIAANLLDQQLTADGPNRRWVGDTTEFVIGESGNLYLAAILDLCARSSWAGRSAPLNDRHLTLKALVMAMRRLCPEAGLLIIPTKAPRMPEKTINGCWMRMGLRAR